LLRRWFLEALPTHRRLFAAQLKRGKRMMLVFCAPAFREIWCLQLCCASAATLEMERGCPPQDNLPKNSKSVILMKY